MLECSCTGLGTIFAKQSMKTRERIEMLSCKEITEKANDYLDKDLPFFTRLKVKMHLRICVHCKRYVEQLQLTIQALGKLNKSHIVDDSTVDSIVENLKKHQH